MNEENLQNNVTPSANPEIKLKTKFKYICASKCKKFALEVAKSSPSPLRAKMFTRVSEEFLIACESNLKQFILSRVKTHPSKGKTLL